MITENKYLKILFTIFSLLCVVGILASFIWDFVTVHTITWSIYVMLSVPFAWVVVSILLLAKKHRIFWVLFGITVFTLPFLYGMEYFMVAKGWFNALAIPVYIAGMVALWLTFIVIRFAKLRVWYLLAFFVFVYGVVISVVVNYFVSAFIGTTLFTLNTFINIALGLIIAILLAIIGYSTGKNKKAYIDMTNANDIEQKNNVINDNDVEEVKEEVEKEVEKEIEENKEEEN